MCSATNFPPSLSKDGVCRLEMSWKAACAVMDVSWSLTVLIKDRGEKGEREGGVMRRMVLSEIRVSFLEQPQFSLM